MDNMRGCCLWWFGQVMRENEGLVRAIQWLDLGTGHMGGFEGMWARWTLAQDRSWKAAIH